MAVALTPAGPVRIVVHEGAVRAVEFTQSHEECDRFGPAGDPGCADAKLALEAARQLAEYGAGARTAFDLPLAPEGTPFQRRVWELLLRIPFGSTTTYGALARELGDAKALRAVGRANGANTLAIVVPCHRVVGADGSLTGYAGGLPRKRALLEHEGALPEGSLFSK